MVLHGPHPCGILVRYGPSVFWNGRGKLSTSVRPSSVSPDSGRHYRIGEAARLSGVSAANIRHYESQGLLQASLRADNQYRYYTAQDIHTLRLIRLCRSLDMSLEETAHILQLDESRPQDCALAIDAIAGHLHHVRERLLELQGLEHKLAGLLQVCDGQGTHCHLIETLHQQADQMDTSYTAVPSARPRHV